MKKVKVVFWILASFSLVTPSFAQEAAPQSAMVFFWAADAEQLGASNLKPLGSGFLVSRQGVVLTAKHVIEAVEPGERIIVSISGKSAFPVPIDETDVLCAMGNRDICAVRVPSGTVPTTLDRVFALECGALGPGTQLRAMGFTGGADRFGGVIQPSGEVVGDAMRAGLIPTDLNMVPTMTGGPVLNSRGNVVGLVKGADSSSNNLTFVTPVVSIKPILEILNIQCEHQTYKLTLDSDRAGLAQPVARPNAETSFDDIEIEITYILNEPTEVGDLRIVAQLTNTSDQTVQILRFIPSPRLVDNMGNEYSFVGASGLTRCVHQRLTDGRFNDYPPTVPKCKQYDDNAQWSNSLPSRSPMTMALIFSESSDGTFSEELAKMATSATLDLRFVHSRDQFKTIILDEVIVPDIQIPTDTEQ